MKKQSLHFLPIFVLLLSAINGVLNAQSNTSTQRSWIWAKVVGSASTSIDGQFFSISADKAGNTYVAASFNGSISFPTSPNNTLLTSEGWDIFIAKYDVSGNVVWAKRAGGAKNDYGYAIKFDGFGNIYLGGSYTESADFGGITLANPVTGSINAFLAKYDASTGNCLWARQGYGDDNYTRAVFDITVDNLGDAYITGTISGNSIKFEPLPTLITGTGYSNIFVVKYDRYGVAQWEVKVDHTGNDGSGNGIAVDNSGKVYITGQFNGSATDPTHFGNTSLVSNGYSDFFLAKYNPSTATWDWAVNGGGPNNDFGMKVSLDSYGYPYVNGYLNSSIATFGATSISETGSTGAFVAKYSPSGTLAWIHPSGAYGQYGWTGSKVDMNGNFYLSSVFSGITSVGSQTLNSSNGTFYIASWNSNGDFQWVKQIAGTNGLNAIDVESNGNIDIAATLSGSETFDCTVLNSLSYSNLVVAKLGTSNLGPDAPTINASANIICPGASITLSIVSGNLNNATGWQWYSGSCGGTLVGSGTSITVSPTQNTTYFVRGEGGCAGPGNCASITISTDIIPPIITCPGNKSVAANNSACSYKQSGTSWDATATDNCSVAAIKYTLSGATTSVPNAFTTLNNVVFNTGVTTVSTIAYDANSNASAPCTYTVTVKTDLAISCTNNNSVLYFGFAGDQTVTVAGTPSGGVAPYTISVSIDRPLKCNVITNGGNETWIGNLGTSTNSDINCPSSGALLLPPVSTANNISSGRSYSVSATLMADAVFTVTVTDALGCNANCTTKVHAEDVRCFAGNSDNAKITLCHQTGDTKKPCIAMCVDQSAVQAHLDHGDFLGNCTPNCVAPPSSISSRIPGQPLEASIRGFGVRILPNPSTNHFTLKVESDNVQDNIKVRVLNVLGEELERRTTILNGQTLQIGNNYRPGVYIIEVTQGNYRKQLKIVKL